MKRRSIRRPASVLTSLRRGRRRLAQRRRRSRQQDGVGSEFMPADVEVLEERTLLTLQFSFTPAAGTPPAMVAGFEEAAGLWKHYLQDDITVNVNVGTIDIPGGPLGRTLNTEQPFTFPQVRTALQRDARSPDDSTAVANITTASSLNLYINLTADNPNGSGSITPYVDNDGGGNNSTISIPRANAKALGLIPGDDGGVDGTIEFNLDYGFDYDRADGITSGQFDFVYVAAHEIGHLLGFVSGVDALDNLDGQGGRPGPFDENSFLDISVLDLYRNSPDSISNGADLDFTADTRNKNFSFDGGATTPGQFATGRNNGDGQQASHWKDNMMMGLLDPTAAPGELGVIRSLDVQAFDVVGWDVVQTSLLPDPVIFGTSGNDRFVVSINRSDLTQLQIQANGTVVATYELSELNSLTFIGFSGDDRVVVDESNGSINLPGGIRVGTVPTMLAPIGPISDAFPMFTWTAEPLADSYELVVRDQNGTEVLRRADIPGTSYKALTALPEGTYTTSVRAVNSFGESDFSAPVTFTINIPVPATPQFLSPPASSTESTPLFKWTDVQYANTYQLEVTDRLTGQRYISQQDLTVTEYTHFNPLPDASYRATIRATNGVGEQSSIGILDFSINAPAPSTPSLTAPAALVSTTLRPRIEWTPVSGADRYDLWVSDVTRGIEEFIRQPQLDSNFFIPLENLAQGRYRVWVRALTISGKSSSWSEPRDFVVDLAVPDIPAFVSPDTLEQTLQIDFRWNAVSLADTYDLWVNDVANGTAQVVRERSLSTNAFLTTLPEGRYAAWVRAINAAGESSGWSEALEFDIDIPVPSAPVPNGPPLTNLGLTQNPKPTMSWSSVPFGAQYDLWVNDATRGIRQVIRVRDLTETEYTPTTSLPDGRYLFWVRAINESGEAGPWSVAYEFVIDTPVPTEPTLNPLPRTVTDRTPLFTWSEPEYAVRYELYIENVTLREFEVVRVRRPLYRPTEDLEPGTYRVWVRAFNSAGEASGWSAPIQFIVTDTAPDLAPAGDGEPELLLASALAPESSADGDALQIDEPADEPAVVAQRSKSPSAANAADTESRRSADATNRPARRSQQPAEPLVAVSNRQQPAGEGLDDAVIQTVMTQWPQHEWWLRREARSTPEVGTSDT